MTRVERTVDSVAPFLLAPTRNHELLRPHPGEVLRSLEPDPGVRADNHHSFDTQIGGQGRRKPAELLVVVESDRVLHVANLNA